jgi:hypothetical protein
MIKRAAARLTTATGIALFVGSASFAQTTGMVDLAALTCKEMMRQTDRDREATVAFVHGFMAGKKQAMIVTSKALEAATDKIIDQCLDSPTSKVMDVFGRN